MDDLIPFLIFIGVALINLVKTAIERGGAKKAPPPARRSAPPTTQTPAPSPTAAPKQSPSTLEEFFEEIAEQFGADVDEDEDFFEEPQPIFETPPQPKPDFQSMRDPQPEAETQLPPIDLNALNPTKIKAVTLHRKAIGSALKSTPNTLLSFDTLKLPSTPLVSSSQAGNLNFPLRERETFRNAIIANIIFSPPRALDQNQQNTHLG